MKPLVCFFKDELYFLSENYEIVQRPSEQTPLEFLRFINENYSDQLKIIQIDFEAFQVLQNHIDLKSSASLITIYLLKEYKIISSDEITLQNTTHQDFDLKFKPTLNQKVFKEKIETIKNDISNGRYYQINFTSSLKALKKYKMDSFELFKYFFQKFKAPYSAFLPYSESEILCYSPELFLFKNNSKIITQPIKGTQKKETLTSDLIKSEKESAELSMIVDLLRNDLQAICKDPVQVSQHRKILELNYVSHTYSEVSGETQAAIPDILEKLLPGGSISGCPKLESLIAIHELEIEPRQFYTGCIGWWNKSDLKLNLAIRSFQNSQDEIKYFAGCGIVYDSDAESEWQEFLNKSSHLKIEL